MPTTTPMLAVAALRAERTALARALWAERIDRRTNCAWSWQRYADALGAAGDFEAAGQARERAAAIAPVGDWYLNSGANRMDVDSGPNPDKEWTVS